MRLIPVLGEREWQAGRQPGQQKLGCLPLEAVVALGQRPLLLPREQCPDFTNALHTGRLR